MVSLEGEESREDRLHVVSLICRSKKKDKTKKNDKKPPNKWTNKIKQKQTRRYGERADGCQAGGQWRAVGEKNKKCQPPSHDVKEVVRATGTGLNSGMERRRRKKAFRFDLSCVEQHALALMFEVTRSLVFFLSSSTLLTSWKAHLQNRRMSRLLGVLS